MKETIKFIYEKLELNYEKEQIETDIENGYLSENKGRDGKDYIWYLDQSHELAVEVGTTRILSEEEIEEILI